MQQHIPHFHVTHLESNWSTDELDEGYVLQQIQAIQAYVEAALRVDWTATWQAPDRKYYPPTLLSGVVAGVSLRAVILSMGFQRMHAFSGNSTVDDALHASISKAIETPILQQV